MFFTTDLTRFGEVPDMVDLILACLICVAFTIFMYVLSRKCLVPSVVFFNSVGLILSNVFELPILIILFTISSIVTLLLYFFINMSTFRYLIANSNKSFLRKKVSKQPVVEKIYDTHTLYQTIDDAVRSLSSTKTGALITFQKKYDLKPFMKNGVDLGGCPVTKELLVTIFYPGTRLHDGAVVIKDGKIVAASVYYALTTRPLNGKYGSRHRAAIGISEISDSVTIVVSEETGRISIATNGEINSVTIDDFLNTFTNLMDQE